MKGPKGSEWVLGKEAACWAWRRKEVGTSDCRCCDGQEGYRTVFSASHPSPKRGCF